MIFAFALSIEDRRYNTNEESAILVTVAELLNIIIPESAVGSAIYIDVPLENIRSVAIDDQADSQSLTPCYAFTIYLSSNTGYSCLTNASTSQCASIALAFASENDARSLESLIQSKLSSSSTIGRTNFSERISVSHDLPHNGNQGFQQAQQTTQPLQYPISVSFGVDVSLPETTDNVENTVHAQQVHASTEPHTNHHELTSTSHALTEVKVVDNSSGYDKRARVTRKLQSEQNPEDDYDSAYDLSPRTQKKRLQISGKNRVLPSPSITTMQELNERKKNDQGNSEVGFAINPAVPNSPAGSPDPDTQTSQQLKLPPNDLELSTSGDKLAENTFPGKVSQRLRGNDGKFAKKAGLSTVAESTIVAESPPKTQLKAKSKPKSKAPALNKSDAGVKKQTKKTKVPELAIHQTKALEDHIRHGKDEYDLEDSPTDLKNAPVSTTASLERNREKSKPAAKTKSQAVLQKYFTRVKDPKTEHCNDNSPEGEPKVDEILAPSDAIAEMLKKRKAKPSNTKAALDPVPNKVQKAAQKAKVKPAATEPARPRSKRDAAMKANRMIQHFENDENLKDIDDAKKSCTTAPLVGNKIENISNASVTTAENQGFSEEATDRASAAQTRSHKSHSTALAESKLQSQSSSHQLHHEAHPTSKSSLNPCISAEADVINEFPQESVLQQSEDSISNSLTTAARLSSTVSKALSAKQSITEIGKTQDVHKGADIGQQPLGAETSFVPAGTEFQRTSPNLEASNEPDTALEAKSSLPGQFGMVVDGEGRPFRNAVNDMEDGICPSVATQLLVNRSPELVESTTPEKRVAPKRTMRQKHQSRNADPFSAKLGQLVPCANTTSEISQAVNLTGDNDIHDHGMETTLKIQDVVTKQPSEKKSTSNGIWKTGGAQQLGTGMKVGPPCEEAIQTVLNNTSEKVESQQPTRSPRKSHKNIRFVAEAMEEDGDMEVKMPAPVIGKKPGLISWNASGPRNQGTISTNQKEALRSTNKAPSMEKTSSVQQSNKRKTLSDSNNLAPWEEVHPTKRQKRDFATPQSNRKHVTEMLAEPPSYHDEKDHRLSFQSTKVDVNGSPMPLAQPQNGTRVLLDDDGIVAGNEDNDSIQHQLPGSSEMSDFGMEGVPSGILTSAVKRASTELTSDRHTVLSNGEIINETTEEVIVPMVPQDPFAGGIEKPPSSFLKMLRKPTDVEVQQVADEVTPGEIHKNLKRKSLVEDEDPEKTLVESKPASKRRKTKQPIVSSTSGSSGSTSKGSSQTRVESENTDDYETKRWLQTMEPHQASMIDMLTVIVHVSLGFEISP